MIQYAITYVEKNVSDDSYKHGASVESRCVFYEKPNIVAPTLESVLYAFRDHYGISADDMTYLAMLNGPGFVAFNRTENEWGNSPTPTELLDFKAGKRKLYLADWLLIIERREVSPLTVDEISELSGVTVES